MTYSVGDGFSWNAEITKPFEYESVEKAEYDFLELCENGRIKSENTENYAERYNFTCFKFCGEEFSWSEFYYNLETLSKKGAVIKSILKYNGPTIQTLEDWFEKNKTN